MATMYSLFLGFLLTAFCSVKGDGSGVLKFGYTTLFVPPITDPSFSMTRTYFFSAKKYAKNSSLKTFDTKFVHPSTIVKNFVGDRIRECRDCAFVSIPLQSNLMSPVKLLTIVEGGTTVRSKGSSDEFWTLLRSKVSRLSGMEDNNKIKNNKALLTDGRQSIIAIASAELGVREATGNNDGPRVEEYLRYTNLGKGYEWCAAFVSWVYGKAGFPQPRNPWSPALFPKARSYKETDRIQSADLFGIYSVKLKRIHHVGLVKERQGRYILTIEGNSNDRVESRRRHVNTVYSYADWVN